MIPVGDRPIVCHIMDYYAEHGHKDFVLCLGYKANSIKQYFLTKQQQYTADLMLHEGGSRVQLMGPDASDWSIGLIDTGVWRSVGERLCAVREHVKNEEMFLANYSDGLTDAPLEDMIETFRRSGKVACFLAVHPMLTFHLAKIDGDGAVRGMVPSTEANIWINGGYFIFRPEIYDYIREGEDLVAEPFARLIAEDQLLAYRYEGFWRPMDTLRDRHDLEEMAERGEMPWKKVRRGLVARAREISASPLVSPDAANDRTRFHEAV